MAYADYAARPMRLGRRRFKLEARHDRIVYARTSRQDAPRDAAGRAVCA